MATVQSPSNPSLHSSPSTGSSKQTSITEIARARMTSPASPPPPLSGDVFDLEEKLERLGKSMDDTTSTRDHDLSMGHVKVAITIIQEILANNNSWDTHDQASCRTYISLREKLLILQKLTLLLPPFDETRLSIRAALETCKSNIGALDEANQLIEQGQASLKDKDTAKAFGCFQQACDLLEKEKDLTCRLVRADTLLQLTGLQQTSGEKKKNLGVAKQEIFALYQDSASFDQDVAAYRKLHELLEKLLGFCKTLDPVAAYYTEGYLTITRTKLAILDLSGPTSLTPSTVPSASTTAPKKVSKGSNDGSGWFNQLFALFVIMGLVVSAVFLYRRSITKIN